MKITILIVLTIVTINMPCLAQEIAPDGLFSLDGTLWWFFCPTIIVDILPPPPSKHINPREDRIGFYQGDVYWCHDKGCIARGAYIDTPVLGIYYEMDIAEEWAGIDLYVMQPASGIGLTTTFWYVDREDIIQRGFGFGIMIKVDKSWEPY